MCALCGVAGEVSTHAIMLDQGKIVALSDSKSVLFDINLMERHGLETPDNKIKPAGALL